MAKVCGAEERKREWREKEKEQKINMAIGMEIRCDSLARLWDCGLAFILALFSFEWGTFRWVCWKSNLIIGKYFHFTCVTIDDIILIQYIGEIQSRFSF